MSRIIKFLLIVIFVDFGLPNFNNQCNLKFVTNSSVVELDESKFDVEDNPSIITIRIDDSESDRFKDLDNTAIILCLDDKIIRSEGVWIFQSTKTTSDYFHLLNEERHLLFREGKIVIHKQAAKN